MNLLVILGTVALTVVGTVLNGWAFSILWGWFFVPTFGLPELLIVQAIGISMVISYLTHQHIDMQSKDEAWQIKLLRVVALVFVRPTSAVLFGWIVNSFM